MSPLEASSFILKTFRMINSCHDVSPPQIPGEICSWSDDGDSFIIKDQIRFTELLPHFFKHKNMRSFVRQLNFYGFRKVRSEGATYTTRPPEWSEFKHDYFHRDREDLLVYIKRTGSSGSSGAAEAVAVAADVMSAHEESELAMIKGEIQRLQQTVNALATMVTTLYSERDQANAASIASTSMAQEGRKRSRASSDMPNMSGGIFRTSSSRSGSRDGALHQLEGVPLAMLKRPTTSVEVLKDLLQQANSQDSLDFSTISLPSSLGEEDMRALIGPESIPSALSGEGAGGKSAEAAASVMTALSRRSSRSDSKQPDLLGGGSANGNLEFSAVLAMIPTRS